MHCSDWHNPLLSFFYTCLRCRTCVHFRWCMVSFRTCALWIFMSLPHPHAHIQNPSHNAENMFGIKIRTFGHSGTFKRRSLIIMNHVSHLDWMYMWSVIDRQGDLSFWKAITKRFPIRSLPILGMLHPHNYSCLWHALLLGTCNEYIITIFCLMKPPWLLINHWSLVFLFDSHDTH